jgi:hypothetical protein
VSPVRAEAFSGHDRSAWVKPNRHSVIVACTWRLASAAWPPALPASPRRSSVRRRAASSLSATDSRCRRYAASARRSSAADPNRSRGSALVARLQMAASSSGTSPSYVNGSDCADESMTA